MNELMNMDYNDFKYFYNKFRNKKCDENMDLSKIDKEIEHSKRNGYHNDYIKLLKQFKKYAIKNEL